MFTNEPVAWGSGSSAIGGGSACLLSRVVGDGAACDAVKSVVLEADQDDAGRD